MLYSGAFKQNEIKKKNQVRSCFPSWDNSIFIYFNERTNNIPVTMDKQTRNMRRILQITYHWGNPVHHLQVAGSGNNVVVHDHQSDDHQSDQEPSILRKRNTYILTCIHTYMHTYNL